MMMVVLVRTGPTACGARSGVGAPSRLHEGPSQVPGVARLVKAVGLEPAESVACRAWLREPAALSEKTRAPPQSVAFRALGGSVLAANVKPHICLRQRRRHALDAVECYFCARAILDRFQLTAGDALINFRSGGCEDLGRGRDGDEDRLHVGGDGERDRGVDVVQARR